MKKFYRLNAFLAVLLLLVLASCAGIQNPAEMSPKQKLTMAYGTYNSQYTMYMTDTGYVLNVDGKWEKVNDPVLSEDKKVILREKKKILTALHPLIKVYDSMVAGITPMSVQTEAEMFALIDQLALLVPD